MDTPCKPATHGSHAPSYELPTRFNFKLLPAEIREYIYPHNAALASPPDGGLPDLLIALQADAKLFEEAKAIYDRMHFNFVVSRSNIEQFKAMRMKELLNIRHLKIVCDKYDDTACDRLKEEEVPKPLSFRAHKIMMHNNFESITWVIGEHTKHLPVAIDAFGPMICASRTGVLKVIVSLPKRFKQDDLGHLIRSATRAIGEFGIEEEGESGVDAKVVSGERIWVLEREDGKSLSTKTPAGVAAKLKAKF